MQRRRLDRCTAERSIRLHWDCDEQWLRWEHVPPTLATVTYVSTGAAPTLVLPVMAGSDGRAQLGACRHAEIENEPESLEPEP